MANVGMQRYDCNIYFRSITVKIKNCSRLKIIIVGLELFILSSLCIDFLVGIDDNPTRFFWGGEGDFTSTCHSVFSLKLQARCTRSPGKADAIAKSLPADRTAGTLTPDAIWRWGQGQVPRLG